MIINESSEVATALINITITVILLTYQSGSVQVSPDPSTAEVSSKMFVCETVVGGNKSAGIEETRNQSQTAEET